MTYMSEKVKLFETYGEDADGAVQAMPNAFPSLWSWWSEHALLATYRREFRAWRGRQTFAIATPSEPQDQLFGAPVVRVKPKRLRRTLATTDGPSDIRMLAGADGAKVLREVAERDSKPAVTTITRCRLMLDMADKMERAAEHGLTITVAELIEAAERVA